MGRAVATMAGTWDASGGFSWELTAPKIEAETDSEAGNEVDQEIVYEAIKAAGSEGIHGWRKLRQISEISQDRTMRAADDLVESGRVTREKKGQGFTFRVEETGMTPAQKEDVQGLIELH